MNHCIALCVITKKFFIAEHIFNIDTWFFATVVKKKLTAEVWIHIIGIADLPDRGNEAAYSWYNCPELILSQTKDVYYL